MIYQTELGHLWRPLGVKGEWVLFGGAWWYESQDVTLRLFEQHGTWFWHVWSKPMQLHDYGWAKTKDEARMKCEQCAIFLGECLKTNKEAMRK